MQPPAYTRTKDFTEDFGSETDHSSLNAEFDAASNSINDIRANLAILQADDGKLNPDVITTDSISAEVRNDLSTEIVQQVQGAVNDAATSAAAAAESASAAQFSAGQASASAGAAQGSAADAAASAAAVNATNLVHRSGDETINGIKTFNAPPVVPDLAQSDASGAAANTNFISLAISKLVTETIPTLINALGFPSRAGNGSKFIRIKADESGYEVRTAAQVRGDIAAAADVQATETVTGTAEVATQAETDAGTDDARIVTPKKLRNSFAGVFNSNGYIKFPSWLGGLVINWGQGTTDAGGNGTYSNTLAFPSTWFGTHVVGYGTAASTFMTITGQNAANVNVKSWNVSGAGAASIPYFVVTWGK